MALVRGIHETMLTCSSAIWQRIQLPVFDLNGFWQKIQLPVWDINVFWQRIQLPVWDINVFCQRIQLPVWDINVFWQRIQLPVWDINVFWQRIQLPVWDLNVFRYCVVTVLLITIEVSYGYWSLGWWDSRAPDKKGGIRDTCNSEIIFAHFWTKTYIVTLH